MLEELFDLNPYSLEKKDKERILTEKLLSLTKHHIENCVIYKNIISAIGFNPENIKNYYDIPFLPVRLFKNFSLKSIEDNQIFKVMTSSGTTGHSVSKIYVDKDTGLLQQKTLIKIMSDFVGRKRLPMLVIDSPKVVKDRNLFSARGAAILGLSMLAKERVYALDENMNPNLVVIDEFFTKYKTEPFIIFGFTFMVWLYLYQFLLGKGKNYNLSNAFLITGGGWKKLTSEQITRDDFKEKLKELCGIGHFIDHYGMVEQTGCIYAECEHGHLHASIFSDVITRNYKNFSPCKIGEKGIIQVVSLLPHSYPGHSLLTEDEGIILGEDDCPCGRKGKYFCITGRIKKAELRGCSDTYAAKF